MNHKRVIVVGIRQDIMRRPIKLSLRIRSKFNREKTAICVICIQLINSKVLISDTTLTAVHVNVVQARKITSLIESSHQQHVVIVMIVRDENIPDQILNKIQATRATRQDMCAFCFNLYSVNRELNPPTSILLLSHYHFKYVVQINFQLVHCIKFISKSIYV